VDGSGDSYYPGGTINVTDNITLYAQWSYSEKYCYVAYEPDEGVGGLLESGILKGSEYTIKSGVEANIINNGLAVLYWVDQFDMTQKYYPGDVIEIQNNMLLTAVWE